jgi:hypothetical protein
MNFSYLSSTGVVAPEYFTEDGKGFLRSFCGGFLTTCGLTNVGSACVDNGEELGVHGRIANIPAEEVYAGVDYTQGSPVMRVSGRVHEARFFGENLTLEREISVRYDENLVHIKDTMENNGFRTEPFMLLYHFNFGHPLLGPETRLYHTPASITARDDAARPGLAACETFEAPLPDYLKQVFFYDMTPQSDKVFACLYIEKLAVGAFLSYRKSQLPVFTQWKHMGEGEYVCGMEPCIVAPIGRAAARESGGLQFLKPGEERRFDIELGVVDGKDELAALRAQ